MSKDETRFSAVAWSAVEEYLAEGLQVSYPLATDDSGPVVAYDIAEGGVALFVGLKGKERAPYSPLPSVRVEPVVHHNRRMARFSASRPELLRDFHDLAMSVAERIVGGGRPVAAAFEETVEAWGALLRRSRGLGPQQRIGLHGELAVLQSLAEREGWPAAVRSWVAPENEQHDFALADYDLEVKTTTSERRHHTVHGAGQLTETPGRSLWFVSVRLTRGGAAGRTLRDSVNEMRAAVNIADSEAARRLDTALETVGWSPDQADDERWVLREEPLVLNAMSMNRITPDMLPTTGHGHIMDVSYTVDVTDAPSASDAPVDLSSLRLP